MNEKKKGMLGFIVLLLFTLGICLVAAIGIGPTKTGSASNIKLGLDLAGGVSITYEVADAEFTQENLSEMSIRREATGLMWKFREFRMLIRFWRNWENQVL